VTDAAPPRLRITRPDRPREVVAVAEARVLAHELTRRLGPLTLDLRVHGEPVGPWLPVEHAGPADAALDLAALQGHGMPPLTALLARTIDPEAADVRRRMLGHLGLLPIVELDDTALADAGRLPLRPTDLWLLASSAERVSAGDPSVAALAHVDDDAVARLDAAFDAVADRLREAAAVDEATTDHSARLAARVRELGAALAEARREADRERVEALQLIEELTAEQRVLRERLERAELGRSLA
jgi:hypothetical protein